MTSAFAFSRLSPVEVKKLSVKSTNIASFLGQVSDFVETLCVRLFALPLPAFTKKVMELVSVPTTYQAFEAALVDLLGRDGTSVAIEVWRTLAFFSARVQ